MLVSAGLGGIDAGAGGSKTEWNGMVGGWEMRFSIRGMAGGRVLWRVWMCF